MIIKELEVLYVPGNMWYQDGIKGYKNYEHTEYNNSIKESYNGGGKVYKTRPSSLTLYGLDENNKEIGPINIKEDILIAFERQKLSEKFVQNLIEKLPNTLEIENDEFGKIILTNESIKSVYGTIHPRKAKQKYK